MSVRAQILNLLMDLKKELGLSMVFISHDIQTVRYISDRIIVINAGQAVEQGTAAEVFNHPKDDYTRLLLGAAPSLLHPTWASKSGHEKAPASAGAFLFTEPNDQEPVSGVQQSEFRTSQKPQWGFCASRTV